MPTPANPVGGARLLERSVRESLVEELAAREDALTLLAFSGEAPVGVAVCVLGFSIFAARLLPNIHDLAVMPGFRGRGIGRALLEGAESRARRPGCCKLTLEIREDDTRVRSLDERLGFGDSAPAREPTRSCFLEKRCGPVRDERGDPGRGQPRSGRPGGA